MLNSTFHLTYIQHCARTHMEIGIALCAERKGCINQGCLHHVGTLHNFKGKYFNQQSSNTVCTVTDLYIAAYPKAEVLLLIPVWLQLINGKRGNSQQTGRGQKKGKSGAVHCKPVVPGSSSQRQMCLYI